MSIIQWVCEFASLRIMFCAIIRGEEKYISGHYLISMSFCLLGYLQKAINNVFVVEKNDLSVLKSDRG